MTNSAAYSVRVKNGAGWRAFSRVRLMISVGQPYHEGPKLEAVVAWINRNPGIRDVHVSVNDYLQRHNLIADGMPAAEAGSQALDAGALWIARNHAILSEMKTAHWRLTRWQDWQARPDFAGWHKALAEYEKGDRGFVKAIDADARTLAERKAKRGEAIGDVERLIAHSGDYVREELAVFAMQAAALPAAEAYPGSNLRSAGYLVGRTLPEPLRPLASRHFTRIDFSRIDTAPTRLVA
jgi:tRNA-dependent cyclodipeptide synthase